MDREIIPADRKLVEVAIAIVFNKSDGTLLVCKRKPDTVLAGYWEFPGGKCDPGETPIACARREVLEETAIHVDVLRELPTIQHDYPYARVRLHPFLCAWSSGDVQLLAVAEARWIHPADIHQFHFPEANRELVHAVSRGLDCLISSHSQ